MDNARRTREDWLRAGRLALLTGGPRRRITHYLLGRPYEYPVAPR